MRRATILKWLGRGAAIAGGIGLAALAGLAIGSEWMLDRTYPLAPSHLHASADPAAIAQGARFAAAYGCADCHTKNLRGAFIEDFAMRSRNLTRLAKTFSDADFDRAVRRGVRPDGTSVAEAMPSDAFQFMADADMAAIVSYIRSLPSVGDDSGTPSYGIVARYGILTGTIHTDRYWFAQQKPALDLGPRTARGRQIAMAACGECHMSSLEGAQPAGAGSPPNLSLVASYDKADFLKLMHTGKAAGNREVGFMSRTARARFSHFSDGELNALYDYLSARGKKLAGG